MSTYTEGPWIIHRADEYTGDVEDHSKIMSITAQNGQTILYTDSGYFKPREEDARLIAAAPDLLEALKHAVNDLESRLYMLPVDADATERAILEAQQSIYNRAIAKAEGRA